MSIGKGLNQKGFTLAEVVVAMGITAIAFGSIFAAYAGVRSLTQFNRSQAQAIQVVRTQIENIKGMAFNNIAGSVTNNVSFDPGPDGVPNNADDRRGTLTVLAQDAADFDSDGNVVETSIDLDADGINDTTNARPIRVTFAWTEFLIGTKKAFTVSIDTLIAA